MSNTHECRYTYIYSLNGIMPHGVITLSLRAIDDSIKAPVIRMISISLNCHQGESKILPKQCGLLPLPSVASQNMKTSPHG